MTRRKSVKNKKGSFAAKAVCGGVCVCVAAAVIGFASTNMLSADEVSVGLGSSGSFSGKVSISSDITPPAASTVGDPSNTSAATDTAAANNASAGATAADAGANTSDEGSKSDAAAGAATGTSAAGAGTGATGAAGTTSAGASTSHATGASAAASTSDVFAQTINGRTVLNELTPSNISADLDALSARVEEERRRAEEEARRVEQAHIQEVQAKQRAYGGESAVEQVDFSVGEQAFVEEWTQRIDAYLAGSNLAGHGCDFAQAAWDYGVDPRWSPAISNTESGKGAHCFLPHNAWGWGASIWFNWTDAIYDHVKGLADGYGYSITYAAAAKYCPPNTANWYQNTVSEMVKI